MVEMQSPRDQAIAWHLRLTDLPGAEWHQFITWLELAPEHRVAYEEVASADLLAAEGLSRAAPGEPRQSELMVPAPPAQGFLRRHFRPLALACAASVAVVAAVGLWPQASSLQLERTMPGNTRQFAFADGTRIDLNGDSALAMDEADNRTVRLDRGEARFAVHHSATPFTVTAGGFAMRDLGTVFNVRLTDRELFLDVVEGSVLFDPEGAKLTVGPGEQVAVDRAKALIIKRPLSGAGDWRAGEFVFHEARLADVVAAMHRRYGVDISLSEGLSARPFSGNVRLSGDAAEDAAHLARLIGAEVRREGQGWIITDSSSRP